MSVWASGDQLVPFDTTDGNRIAKLNQVANGGRAITLVDGTTASYDALYRRQVWVRAAIDKLAHGIGRLPAKVYRDLDSPNARERVRRGEHRGADLIYRPYPGGTPFKYWARVVHEMAKCGRGHGVMLRPEGGGIPDAIVPVGRQQVQPKIATDPNGGRHLLGYVVEIAGMRRLIPAEDVVNYDFPNGGVSPLETLSTTLALEDAGQRAAIASFRNGIRPSGIVSLDPQAIGQKTGRMTSGQLAYLKDELQAEHGGVDRRFRLAAINAAIRWNPLAHSAQEAEMIEHRRLNREEVCGVYDIPPPILHILDRATYSNIDEQHRMLYMDTLGPWLTNLEQTHNAAVFEHPTLAPIFGGVYLEFDLDGVMRGDLKTRSESYQRMIGTGFSLNDIRGMENRPRIEHPLADAIFYPLNLKAVGPDLPTDLGDASIAAARLGLAAQYQVVKASEVRDLLRSAGVELDDDDLVNLADENGNVAAVVPTTS